MNKFVLAIGFVLLLGIGILSPVALIWALNTLFPILNIAYTLETWSAMNVLMIFSYFTFSHHLKGHSH